MTITIQTQASHQQNQLRIPAAPKLTLLEWFQNLRLKTGMCTGPIMIEKANQFSVSFGLPPTCDKNYIYRWRERNSVVWHGKTHGEATKNTSHLMTTWRLAERLRTYRLSTIS